MLRLYNTLNKKIEDFQPINKNQVGMYTCGPTVYDYMHIGNLRTFLFSDMLHRALLANNYQVKSVRNITDIDDKIIKKAKENNASLNEITDQYTKLFFEDLLKLNILPVNINSKATEHITKMIKFIEDLIKKKKAYVENDGSVYFDISEFPEYGKLSQLDKRSLKTGTRILSDEYTKDDVQDFALWKSVEANEVGGYDSPWGRGRPGWHIECSVMSSEYLGDTFDIHTGGIDLIFPHHENEIAQSEARSGKKFVNYFVHGEHILVSGAKMSKSLKNFYTLKDLQEKGFDPLALRYLVLTAHYRDKLNFTWDSLQAAQNALNNLQDEIRSWPNPQNEAGKYYEKFLDAVNNDLNMPQAVAVLHEMIHNTDQSYDKSADLLAMDKILGLQLDQYLNKTLKIPGEVQKLVKERELARKSGDFEKSDQLREKINDLGYEIEDSKDGQKINSIRR